MGGLLAQTDQKQLCSVLDVAHGFPQLRYMQLQLLEDPGVDDVGGGVELIVGLAIVLIEGIYGCLK